MEIYKAVLIGVTSVLLGLLFKGGREEYSLYLSLGAGLLLLFMAVSQLQEVIALVQLFQEELNLEEGYLQILFKMLAVTWLCQFAAAICRDCSNSAVAGQIEMFGRLTLAALGAPVFMALLQLITEVLQV